MANDIELTIGMNAEDALDTADNLQEKIKDIFNKAYGKQLSASTKSLLQSLDSLNTRMTRIKESMADLRGQSFDNEKWIELNDQLKKIQAETTKVVTQMQDIASKKSNYPTQEYQDLQNKLKGIQQEAAKVNGRLEQFYEQNEKNSTSKLRRNIERYEKKLADLGQQALETARAMKSLEDSDKAFKLPDDLLNKYKELVEQYKKLDAEEQKVYDALQKEPRTHTGEITEEYQQLGEALNAINNRITVVNARLSQTPEGRQLIGTNQQWATLGQTIQRVAVFMVRVPFQTVWAGLKLTAKFAKASYRALWQLVSPAIRSGLSKLSSYMFGLGKSSQSTNDIFKKGIKTLIRYGFGVRSLYFLIRRLRTMLLKGLEGIGEAYAPFGQTIQSFKNALNELKSAFVSAFAPVASTVIPILNTLMNVLTSLLNRLAMLFAALRGQSTYIKGNLVEATDAAASSAGHAADEAERYKKTIAGFDDVEILQAPKDSGSGGGGGGGGGSSGDSWTVEQLPIDTAIKAFADRIRELIAEQDWEGLGNFLGEKVNNFFQQTKEKLNSSELQTKIDTVITGITTTLNSLVNKIDWELIGSTFGSGINLLLTSANKLMTGIDWKKIGTSIGEGLNGLIQEIKWEEVGSFFANKLNILIDTADGFVNEFDWEENAKEMSKGINKFVEDIHWDEAADAVSKGLSGAFSGLATILEKVDWEEFGKKLADFLTGIDWLEIQSSFNEALGKAIKGAIELLWGFIGEAWDKFITDWADGGTKDGEDIAKGILEGVKNIFNNIKTWVKDNIFTPFLTGLKKAFGIESPAKEMEDPGKNIGQGLLNGIASVFKNIKTWVQQNILDKIVEAVGNVQETISVGIELVKSGWEEVGSWVMKSTGDIAKKGVQLVKSGWKEIGSWVMKSTGDIAKKGVQLVKSGWNTVGSWITNSHMGNAVTKGIGLTKNFGAGIVTIAAWVRQYMGNAVNKSIGLAKNFGARINTVAAWVNQYIGGTVSVGVSLFKSGWTSIKSFFGLANGGIIGANGGVKIFGSGGRISRLSSEFWKSLPKYAKGTSATHGTMFVAGESGPEIVGHVGGRTEVLNKSQIASAIYSAVLSAMTRVSVSLVRYVANTIISGTNSLIYAISALQNAFSVPLPVIVVGDIHIPEIAVGQIVPAMAQLEIAQRNNELLASAVDAMSRDTSNRLTNEALEEIITRVIRRTLNIQFYIGDEQIARHANAGNDKLAIRYNKSTR